MIRYQLRCDQDHSFEGWFKDSHTYDAQAEAGDIACPICGSTVIRKAPMAPAIGGKATGSDESVDPAKTVDPAPGQSVMAPNAQDEFTRQVVDMMQKLRKHVESNFDYVGDSFADEARAIHQGDAEERGIYGEATPQESQELSEEGIEVFSLPFPDKEKVN